MGDPRRRGAWVLIRAPQTARGWRPREVMYHSSSCLTPGHPSGHLTAHSVDYLSLSPETHSLSLTHSLTHSLTRTNSLRPTPGVAGARRTLHDRKNAVNSRSKLFFLELQTRNFKLSFRVRTQKVTARVCILHPRAGAQVRQLQWRTRKNASPSWWTRSTTSFPTCSRATAAASSRATAPAR